jgi:hypothetical protein
MRDLASIQKIAKLTPIEGADRIEVATILGWEVIIEKGKYNINDLVVYVEPDVILPEREEFEFLRSRCWNKTYNGFRIKNMKMRGVFSQGIVFQMSILPFDAYKEGQVVRDLIGCVRYAPEELKQKEQVKLYKGFKKLLLKYSFFRNLLLPKKKSKSYPDNIKKSGETNIQKDFNRLTGFPNTEYYKTEKLEGQAATYSLERGRFCLYSHNVKLTMNGCGNWQTIAKQLDIESLLRSYKKKHKRSLCIQGEIIGSGIQKNIYNINGLDFYVYRIKDLTSNKYLEIDDMIECCSELGLKTVPIIDRNVKLYDSVKDILSDADGKSVLYDVKREGVVWRSETDQTVGFKARSPEYLLWWG